MAVEWKFTPTTVTLTRGASASKTVDIYYKNGSYYENGPIGIKTYPSGISYTFTSQTTGVEATATVNLKALDSASLGSDSIIFYDEAHSVEYRFPIVVQDPTIKVTRPSIDHHDFAYSASGVNVSSNIQDYDSSAMIQKPATPTGTTPGTYTIMYTLKPGYEWSTADSSGSTTAAHIVEWEILKAPQNIWALSDSLEFTDSNQSKSTTIKGLNTFISSCTVDPAYSEYASATYSGDTVTITSTNEYTSSPITVTVNAAESNISTASSTTITVTLTQKTNSITFSRTPNNIPWGSISAQSVGATSASGDLVTFTIGSTSIATINPVTNRITGVDPGTTKVYASCSGTGWYGDATNEYNLTITAQDVTVTTTPAANFDSEVYSGDDYTLQTAGSFSNSNAGYFEYGYTTSTYLEPTNWSSSPSTESHVGTFYIYYRVKQTTNQSKLYNITNATIGQAEIISSGPVHITSRYLTIPTITEATRSVVFDGKTHTVQYNNFDSTYEEVNSKSTTSARDVASGTGIYTVYWDLKKTNNPYGNVDIYWNWNGGVTTQQSQDWYITPKTVGLRWGTTEWAYDGESHHTSCDLTGIENPDSVSVTLDNNSVGPDVDSQTVRATAITGSQKGNYKLPSYDLCATTISINKADPQWSTEPSPKTGIVYDGESHFLVNLGDANGGSGQYKLSTETYYLPQSPFASQGNTYTVQYYIEGDANHNDGGYGSTQVTISPASQTISTNPTSLTVSSTNTVDISVTAKTSITASTDDTDYITVTYSGNTVHVTPTQFKNNGPAIITITAESTNNYKSDDVTVPVAFVRSIPTITWSSKPVLLSYGDISNALSVQTDSPATPTFEVQSTAGTDPVVSIDSNNKIHALKVGTATIKVTIPATEWFTSNSEIYTITVQAKTVTVNAPSINPTSQTYTGSGITLASNGACDVGGTFYIGTSSDASTEPTEWERAGTISKVNAGTYYIWYKVTAISTNYTISGGEGARYLGSYQINTARATKTDPTPVTATLTYNGEDQTLYVNGSSADGEFVVTGGVQKNAGTHTISWTFNPDSNHHTGSHDYEGSFTKEIKTASIEYTAQSIEVLYGQSYSPAISITDGQAYKDDKPISDILYKYKNEQGEEVQKPTARGTYTIYIVPQTYNNNYYVTLKSGTLTIYRNKVAVPTISDATKELQYNGDWQSPTIVGLDYTKISSDGNLSAKYVPVSGKYRINWLLIKETDEWEDTGDRSERHGEWEITPLPTTLTWNNTTKVYDGSPLVATCSVDAKITGDDVSVSLLYNNIGPDVSSGFAQATELTGEQARNYSISTEAETSKFIQITRAQSYWDPEPEARELYYQKNTPQELTTSGIAVGGQAQYKLGSTGEYSSSVPNGEDSKKYFVYYKIVGDNNHNDTEEKSVAVTIHQGTPTVTFSDQSLSHNYSTSSYTISFSKATSNSDGEITYAKNSGDFEISGNSIIIPAGTNAGNTYSVSVTATVAATSNYTSASITKTMSISISKINPTITFHNQTLDDSEYSPSIKNIPFTPATVTGDGTVSYSLVETDNDKLTVFGAYLQANGLGASAKTWNVTVRASVAESTNYLQGASDAIISVRIIKATPTISLASNTYHVQYDTAQQTVEFAPAVTVPEGLVVSYESVKGFGTYNNNIVVPGKTGSQETAYVTKVIATTVETVNYNAVSAVATNINVVVDKRQVTIPEVSGLYEYDRDEHFAIINNSSNWYTQTGTSHTDQANAPEESYELIFNLNDTANCVWSDNSISYQTGYWRIAQRDATITVQNISATSSIYTPSVELSGVISPDTLYDSITYLFNGKTERPTTVGEFEISATLTNPNPNYNITLIPGTLSISQDWTATATVSNIETIYDGETKVVYATLKASSGAWRDDQGKQDVDYTIKSSDIYSVSVGYSTFSGDTITIPITIKANVTIDASVGGSIKFVFSEFRCDDSGIIHNFGATVEVSANVTVRTRIPVPQITNLTKRYSGEEQGPTIVSEPLETYAQRSGTRRAKYAGDYVISYDLLDKRTCCWDDADEGYPTSSQDTEWTIDKAPASITIQNINTHYNDSYTPTAIESGKVIEEPLYTSITYLYNGSSTKPTTVGEYSITAELTGANQNYDITIVPATLKISPKVITRPEISGDSQFTYDLSYVPHITIDRDLTWTTLDKSSIISASLPGQYSAIVNLNDTVNLVWDDDTTDPITLDWEILKRRISVPNVPESRSYEYTGENQYISIPYDSTWVSLSGDTYAKVVGNDYSFTFTLVDKENTTWDETGYPTADKTYGWEITKKLIEQPSVGELHHTYDGDEYTITTSVDSDWADIDGTFSATEYKDGGYTFTASLKDPVNTGWKNTDPVSSENISYKWFIDKRDATITVNHLSVPFGDDYGKQITYSISNVIDGDTLFEGYEIKYNKSGETVTPYGHGLYGIVFIAKSVNKNYSANVIPGILLITVRKMEKPTTNDYAVDYSGDYEIPVVENYDFRFMEVSGTVIAKDAGTYHLLWTIKDTENSTWIDDTTTQVPGSWTINRVSNPFEIIGTNEILSGKVETYSADNVQGDALVTWSLVKQSEFAVLDQSTLYVNGSPLGDSVKISATTPETKNYKETSKFITVKMFSSVHVPAFKGIGPVYTGDEVSANNGQYWSWWDADVFEMVSGDTGTNCTTTQDGVFAILPELTQKYRFNVDPDNVAGASTVTVQWKVQKAQSEFVTTPTAVEGLRYRGTLQFLVTGGATLDGTIMYKVDDGDYSESIPQGYGAKYGNKPYVVSYKIVGDENHQDTAEESINVEIRPSEVTYQIQNISVNVGQSYNPGLVLISGEVAPGDDIFGDVTSWTYEKSGSQPTTDKPVSEGVYTIDFIWATINTNYSVSILKGTLTISKTIVTIPEIIGTYPYSAREQIVQISDFDTSIIEQTGTISAKDHASSPYAITWKLLNPNAYKWEDWETDSSITRTKTWNIDQLPVTAQWHVTSWTYDGQEHSTGVTINGAIASERVEATLENNKIGPDVTGTPVKVTITELSSPNYYISNSTSTTLTLLPAETTWLTEPAGKTLQFDPTSDGQELITGGTTTSGTPQYRLSTGTEDDWDEEIPTGRDCGEYTVLCRIVPDTNHKVTASSNLSKTTVIQKIANPIQISDSESTIVVGKSVTYQDFGTKGGATVTWKLLDTTYADLSGSTVSPKGSPDGAKVTLQATASETANYNETSVTKEITLMTAIPVPTWIEHSLTYNGAEQFCTDYKYWNNYYSELCTFNEGVSGTDAGYHTVNLTTSNSSKYRFCLSTSGPEGDTGVSGIGWIIDKKEVELVWDATSWAYDGNLHFPQCEAVTRIPNKTVSVTLSGRSAGPNVGMSGYANATSLGDGTDKASNYKLPEDTRVELTITKADQSWSIAPTSIDFTGNYISQSLVIKSGTNRFGEFSTHSSDESVAVVTKNDKDQLTVEWRGGVASGVEVSITYSGDNNHNYKTQTISVNAIRSVPDITWQSKPGKVNYGATTTVAVKATSESGKYVSIESDNPACASVDVFGYITGIGSGSCQIVAHCDATTYPNGLWDEATDSYTFTVLKAPQSWGLSQYSIELSGETPWVILRLDESSGSAYGAVSIRLNQETDKVSCSDWKSDGWATVNAHKATNDTDEIKCIVRAEGNENYASREIEVPVTVSVSTTSIEFTDTSPADVEWERTSTSPVVATATSRAPITLTSSMPTVLSIDKDGYVTSTKALTTVTITATCEATDLWTSATAGYSIRITKRTQPLEPNMDRLILVYGTSSKVIIRNAFTTLHVEVPETPPVNYSIDQTEKSITVSMKYIAGGSGSMKVWAEEDDWYKISDNTWVTLDTSDTQPYVNIYVDGRWVQAQPYIYDKGTWKPATAHIYDKGSWKSTKG